MSNHTELVARVELVESEAMHQLQAGAPQPVRAALGITTRRLGGGVVLAMAEDPTGYWSKALGFGVGEPVTRRLIEQVCAFYDDSGAHVAVLQIAPSLLPPDWEAVAAACGLRRGAAWVKMLRPAAGPPPEPPRTDLQVGAVPEADLSEWAEVLLTGMGMPADLLAPMFTATTAGAFHHFAAWDGGDMVAAACLFVHEDTAEMFGAATLQSHRGRGAQTALLTARIGAAAAAGTSWISAETGAETPERSNPSLRNLRRAGFSDLYERSNWVWRRPPGADAGLSGEDDQ